MPFCRCQHRVGGAAPRRARQGGTRTEAGARFHPCSVSAQALLKYSCLIPGGRFTAPFPSPLPFPGRKHPEGCSACPGRCVRPVLGAEGCGSAVLGAPPRCPGGAASMAWPGRRWVCNAPRRNAAGHLGLFLVARLSGEPPWGQTKRNLPHRGTRERGVGGRKKPCCLYKPVWDLVGDKGVENKLRGEQTVSFRRVGLFYLEHQVLESHSHSACGELRWKRSLMKGGRGAHAPPHQEWEDAG